MMQMQETNHHIQTPQFSKLYKEVSFFIKDFGVDNLLEFLLIVTHCDREALKSKSKYVNVTFLISYAIKNHGVEFMYLILKTNQTKISRFEVSKTDELTDKVFEIVCSVFKTTKEVILDKHERDGIRVSASGTLFKLFSDVLGYTVDDVMEITSKDRTAISRHKNIIKKLDPKHPTDRKVLIKYIDSKKQLIKFILNEYRET